MRAAPVTNRIPYEPERWAQEPDAASVEHGAKTRLTIGDVLRNLEEVVAGAVLLALVAIVAYSVFRRYVLNSPVGWAQLLPQYLLVWLTMLGSAIGSKRHAHLAVTALLDALPEQPARALAIAVQVIQVVVLATLAYYGAKLTLTNDNPTAISGLSFQHIYLSVPVGATLMTMYSLRDLYHLARPAE